MDDLTSVFVFVTLTALTILVARRRGASDKTVEAPAARLFQGPVFGSWTEEFAEMFPTSATKRERLLKDLSLSGAHQAHSLDEFLAWRNLIVLGVFLAACVGFALGIADGNEVFFVGAAGTACLVSYAIPRLALSGRAAKRKRELSRAIPDAIDMIAMSLDGGVPLPQAIRQAEKHCRELYPALASELRVIDRQSESGGAEHALNAFADRIDMPEVAAWSAMMRQSQKLGGKLSGSLRDYAMRIRLDRQTQVERAGNSASLKLLLPVILCLAPPIAIVLVGPAVIEFRDFINRNKDATQSVIQQAQSTDGVVEL
ncbi:type II secretion system F family protein [Rhodopirellula sp. MGV]|uniref:type II secretion system F family protein n=1 Tax=Rhodopirellula sp. MGV TaxID=2023130 RepID=UPI000B9708A9|nr:type II secretion system F family protein [Rhodopirellula sp. MGV]OYP37704.1 hypothetical protein CGZ80_04255 [Rhodopirellula sp. MGV]PNY37142.1 type II secretion system F family protein [Rhodopirellula baltica]